MDAITMKDVAAAIILIMSLVSGSTVSAREHQTESRFMDKFGENQDGGVAGTGYPVPDEGNRTDGTDK